MDFDKVLEEALAEYDRWDWGGGTSDSNGYYVVRIGDDDKQQIIVTHLFTMAIAENEVRKRAIAAILAQAISRLTEERDRLKTVAINAAATIGAFYEWFDRVEKAGGATSISGVAACNAMLKSMRTNRKRTFDLVIKPIQDALATPSVPDADGARG